MERSVRIIGFPWEEKSTLRRGAQLGPWAIRRHLISRGMLGGVVRADLNVRDGGVVALPPDDAAFQRMEQIVAEAVEAGEVPVVLGGDHTVTLPTLHALSKRYGALTVLWIDRHADLQPDFLGDRWSHACAAARLLEAGVVKALWLWGVRHVDRREIENARRWPVFRTEERPDWRHKLGEAYYVSIDLDVLDPRFAPGASAGLEGGVRPEKLLELIHSLPDSLVGFDVVELNPRLDRAGTTARLAAEIVALMCEKLARREEQWKRSSHVTVP